MADAADRLTREPTRESGAALRPSGADTPGTIERLLTPRSAPPHVIVLTALTSYAAIGLALVAGWPSWAVVAAATAPWLLVFSTEVAWTYRHFHWLALFYALVVTQGGHFIEHLVQMVQIHVLDRTGHDARGVFGNLDTEWVHFAWNTWVLIAVVALLTRYRRNPWLWLGLVFALWHELEHSYIMVEYLSSDAPGNPGLLADGGAIGGGLGLTRPDLHFLYNVVETVPLVVAFIWTLHRTYDEWLARALPHAPDDLLVDTTRRAASIRFPAGDTIIRQGDAADRFYVLVRGEVEAVATDDDDRTVFSRRLSPGEFFGEMGLLTADVAPRTATVRALTPVEVLSLDRAGFSELVTRSRATADDLARVSAGRAEEQGAARSGFAGPPAAEP